MSSIATCPQCAAQLAVPETATTSDHAQCPECRAEFSLAEGDLRYLSAAKIVDPIEIPPAPIEPKLETPAPAAKLSEVPLPDAPMPETPLPVTPEPVAELPEAPLPETEPPQDMRNAETILSPSTLSGWEERLRVAIDSTETQPSDEPEIVDSPTAEESSLEESPKFEFEMDPPAESLADSFGSTATELPETGEWFEPTSEQTSEESLTDVAPATADDAPTANKRAAPVRRSVKNSLLKRAAVVVMFGTVGILLGQYALLWLRGPSADYLHIAQFVPRAILPSAQQQVFAPQISAEEHLVSDETPIEEPEIEQPVEKLLASAEPVERELDSPAEPPVVTRDDAVQPATAQLPEASQLPEVSLLSSTHTTPAEFDQLLRSAHDSAQTLIKGDLSTQESYRSKGHAYMAFCRLAERIDFIRDANLDEDARNQASSAQSLFRTLAGQTAAQNDLALITLRWWQHPTRTNQGIFFVGRVQEVETMGSHALCQVAVVHAAESTLIPVLLPMETARQVGEQIGVVGTIITEPHTVLPGFTANLPQIAVAVESFSVPAE